MGCFFLDHLFCCHEVSLVSLNWIRLLNLVNLSHFFSVWMRFRKKNPKTLLRKPLGGPFTSPQKV